MTFKKIIAAFAAASTITIAGGDIAPTEPQVTVEPALTGIYVGAGYTYLANDLDVLGLTLSDGQNGGTILAGYNFNDYVAVEGRYTFTSNVDFNVANRDFDSDTWGIYVKPQYPVSSDVKVYALLGYGDVKAADNGDGFQYGVGAAYSATKNVEVFVDWVRMLDDDSIVNGVNADLTTDAFTMGVNYKF